MRRIGAYCFACLVSLDPVVAGAHDFAPSSPPLVQPASPVKLKSCYLGTNYDFGDPKLKGEETKMRFSANLAEICFRSFDAPGKAKRATQ
jgi:hypothetical protein